MKSTLYLFCLLFCLYGSHIYAGALERFEQDVVNESEYGYEKGDGGRQYHSQSNLKESDNCESFGECLFEVFFDVFSGALSIAENSSMAWVRGESGITARQVGDPLLPVARVKLLSQNLQDDVDAKRVNLELGYGVLAVVMSETRYQEENPDDELKLRDIHALYRLAFNGNIGVGIGLGHQKLLGEQETSGVSFVMPLQVKLTKEWGVEMQGKWSNLDGSPIESYDAALLYHFKYSSLILGYETLNSPNESLHGPYFGFSLQW